jgi:hypothetical protein
MFFYSTKDKNLKMKISAAFYEPLEVNRNLENAPEEEKIELKRMIIKWQLIISLEKILQEIQKSR